METETTYETEEMVEAMETLKATNVAVREELSLIGQLKDKIAVLQMQILKFENANNLYEYVRDHTMPYHIEEETGCDTDEKAEIDLEHLSILRQKRSKVKELKNQSKKLSEEYKSELDTLQSTQESSLEFEKNCLILQDNLRVYEEDTKRSREFHQFLEVQLSDMEADLQTIRLTRIGHEAALKDLQQREERSSDSILTIRTTIEDTRKMIGAVDEEISSIKKDIENLEQIGLSTDAESAREMEKITTALDWQTERQELRDELDALTEELLSKKPTVAKSEAKITNSNNRLARYLPLFNKWNGELRDQPIPEGTVADMWRKLEATKAEMKEKEEASAREMAGVIATNEKLLQELNRRKLVLKRVIDRFHTEESQQRRSVENNTRQAEEDESKLLKQIRDAKLKHEQRKLNRGL